MTSVHEPHDAFRVPSMDKLAKNGPAVVHGVVQLPNTARLSAWRLTVLSSLLISLGVAFLVMRCFVAVKSRKAEHEYAMNLRRLALDGSDGCLVSIRTKNASACVSAGGFV